jgi:signal transduction histidine kinase
VRGSAPSTRSGSHEGTSAGPSSSPISGDSAEAARQPARLGTPILRAPGLLLCLLTAVTAVLPLLTSMPAPVWILSNALSVVVQIIIPPMVALTRVGRWKADADRRVRHSAEDAVMSRMRARIQIERDLHDGAQLRLINTAMLLTLARGSLGDADTTARAQLSRAVGELAQAVTELRLLAQGVRPPALSRRGLHEALAVLAAGTPARVRIEGRPVEVPIAVAEVVYFTVAEALTNAVRHGGASAISVRLRRDAQDDLHAEIQDNGAGGAHVSVGGGLSQLRHRLGELGGRLEVVSAPRRGTTVRVVIPCVSSLQTTQP